MDQILDIDIEKMSFGGEGIGYQDGKVIFVEGTLPGDKAKIKIYREKKSFAKASLMELIEPSKNRVSSPCAYSNTCGGCPWINAPYEDQLLWKKSFINSALDKIAKIDAINAKTIIASEKRLGYRNRVKLKAHVSQDGTLSLGYFAKQSHRLVSIDSCKIADPLIDKAIGFLSGKNLGTKLKKPFHVDIQLQVIEPDRPSIMADISIHPKRELSKPLRIALKELLLKCSDISWVSCPGISSRKRFSYDRQEEVNFLSSSGEFQQVNLNANHALRMHIKDLVKTYKPKSILDLYCGSGNLSLLLSGLDSKVIGVESNAESITTATQTVEKNEVNGADYLCAKAEQIGVLLKKKGPFDFIIVDPPRAGLKDAIDDLIHLKAAHICYVSCDPNTLARDLGILSKDYKVESVIGLDFFPQTYHVETIVFLSRI